jgi:ubiquinone/menaquinone biosynthesis C-methylase UbiE
MELEKIGAYWNLRAEGYSMRVNEQLQGDEKEFWLSLLQKHSPGKSAMDCLDIGCGPGFLSILLAEGGHSVTAVDYSENMLSRARQNFTSAGVTVNSLQMDAQALRFANESFDYIVTRDLVWNLEFPERAYAEWLRVLRPGGHILILDGNYYLHYYSEEYRDAKEAFEAQDRAVSHRYMLGVDPTPIDTIAKALPLSREIRPAWDISCFIDAGASSVNTDIVRRKFRSQETGEEKTIIKSFAVCAVKPTMAEEN